MNKNNNYSVNCEVLCNRIIQLYIHSGVQKDVTFFVMGRVEKMYKQ